MELVSVAMPVYNAEKYICEALESVLNQTYQELEIIIVDDGSFDRSADLIRQYRDPRIKYYRNETNRGIVYSLNRALSLCSGTYIARMDADDVCESQRIERQVDFLETHPEITIISTAYRCFGQGRGTVINESDPEIIKCKMIFAMPLLHPGWMMRSDFIRQHHIQYREYYKYLEDGDFLIQAMEHGAKLSNLKECLMNYRITSSQASSAHKDDQNAISLQMTRNMANKLGLDWNDDRLRLFHNVIGKREILLSVSDMKMLFSLLYEWEKQNESSRLFDSAVLFDTFAEEQYYLCRYNLTHHKKSGLCILKSRYFFSKKIQVFSKIKFLIYSLYILIFGDDDIGEYK